MLYFNYNYRIESIMDFLLEDKRLYIYHIGVLIR